MQDAFEVGIWIVCGVSAVVAIIALSRGRRTWEDYGSNHLLLDRDAAPGPRRGSAASEAERDLEIRQMLEARNARRLRRGEEPLDVEREIARLSGPVIDPGLREEIRDLVIARNHRRARQGKPPLDVDAEVEREITSLRDL